MGALSISHAGVSAELQSDPVNFMSREKGYERYMYDRSHPRTASNAKNKNKNKEKDKDRD